MTNKPSEIKHADDLQDFYWLKIDLISFCKKNNLSSQGGKLDLIARIKTYFLTGCKTDFQLIKKTGGIKDSAKLISKNTIVKNYNNDIGTRKFFVDQLGEKFKFNAYLRQFTDKNNITPNMTYSDLVEGCILFESKKKSPDAENIIPEQFEYNQFIKDYFQHECDATLKTAISAWKNVSSKKGENTYTHFKFINKNIK